MGTRREPRPKEARARGGVWRLVVLVVAVAAEEGRGTGEEEEEVVEGMEEWWEGLP